MKVKAEIVSGLCLALISGTLLNIILNTVDQSYSIAFLVLNITIQSLAVLTIFFQRDRNLGLKSSLLYPSKLFATFFFLLFTAPYIFIAIDPEKIDGNRFIIDSFANGTVAACFATSASIVFFALGCRLQRSLKSPNFNSHSNSVLPILPVLQIASGLLAIFLFSIFIVTGGLTTLFSAYTGLGLGSNTADGVYFLTTHFSMQSLALNCTAHHLSRKVSRVSIMTSLPSFFWCVLCLASGDRNTFLLVSSIVPIYYFSFVRRPNIVAITASIFVALVVYQFIEVYRSSDDFSASEILSEMFQSSDDGNDKLTSSSFNITTLTLRATFADNPSGDPLFYGKFKLVGLMGIAPYSRSLFFNPEKEHVTSAEYLSDLVLGSQRTWSVGSNIVSDILLDFGIASIPIFFLLIGIFCNSIALSTLRLSSLYALPLYLLVCTLFFQLPRYSLDFPVRSLTWLIVFLFAMRWIALSSNSFRGGTQR